MMKSLPAMMETDPSDTLYLARQRRYDLTVLERSDQCEQLLTGLANGTTPLTPPNGAHPLFHPTRETLPQISVMHLHGVFAQLFDDRGIVRLTVRSPTEFWPRIRLPLEPMSLVLFAKLCPEAEIHRERELQWNGPRAALKVIRWVLQSGPLFEMRRLLEWCLILLLTQPRDKGRREQAEALRNAMQAILRMRRMIESHEQRRSHRAMAQHFLTLADQQLPAETAPEDDDTASLPEMEAFPTFAAPPEAAGWRRVVHTAEVGEDGLCPQCGEDAVECPCPGPTMEGYEYRTVSGVMEGRPLAP